MTENAENRTFQKRISNTYEYYTPALSYPELLFT